MKFSRKSLKWNTLANLTGRLWSAGLSIIAVPFFIKILGPEAYGLVGLFASFQVVFALLDLGLSATINREIARNVAIGKPNHENADLLRTLEVIYWAIGLAICIIVLLSSGWIAEKWVNVRQLSISDVRLAIMIMALSFASQWPVSLYTGVLFGLQEQILQNIIFISATTLRTLGALAAVIWISPNILVFLLTQAIANIFEVSACAFIAWRLLNRNSHRSPIFSLNALNQIWRFALTFNAVGVVGMLVSQADRLIISKFLPLDQLGYYSIASTAAGAMPLISAAVATAIFPRFSAYAALGDKTSIARQYHVGVQSVAFLTVAVALTGAFFSKDILILWTRSTDVAGQTSIVLSLLAVSSLLNAFQNPAYTLLIANNNTKLPLLVNCLNGIVFIPLMLFVIPMWGIEGAAIIGIGQNIVYLLVYMLFVRKVIIRGENNGYWGRDVLLYVLLGCLWVGAARLLTYSSNASLTTFIVMLIAAIGYCGSAVFLSKYLGMFPGEKIQLFRWKNIFALFQ